MPNTFFGLNIGTTGLYTYQAQLSTTAHNASNAETEGYTRQILGQTAGVPLYVNSTYGMVGTGVTGTSTKQVRNEYYDIKYRDNNTLYGEYSTKAHYMTEVETYFNEFSTDGFMTNNTNFFASLQSMAKDPGNEAVRKQAAQYAEGLTEYFNNMYNSLQSIQEEANFEIKNMTDKVNSISKQVAMLTKQINTIEIGGGTANDLRDQRELLVDKLSAIVDVSVTEKFVGDGIGKTSYVVRIGSQVLVDTTDYNNLATVPREDAVNLNDVEGLYDLKIVKGDVSKYTAEEIKDAADIDIMSPNLTGTLQALFEVRDGNNNENLTGKVTALAGATTITLDNASIDEINKLNITETGVIKVGAKDYNYTGFSVTVDASGEYQYQFTLETPLVSAVTAVDAKIGDAINYKGIPYYMSQLNELARTFSEEFNSVHKTGEDLEGNKGVDFFNAVNKLTGDNYVFADASVGFTSTSSSYYKMTASNFCVAKSIMADPNTIASATDIQQGVENHDILDKLILLKDKKMFDQGTPASFIQTMVAEVGIDAEKAEDFSENQSDILGAIENQRLSISGVDIDEEAMNLIRFQNAYNLSAKVIQVMDEIYDKLINYMGA